MRIFIKFLIVSTGRCGSTFLSAILSQAGANFGLAPNTNWNQSSGSYEHPDLDQAYKWHKAAQKIHRELWPFNSLSKWCRNKRDQKLQNIFNQIEFAKTTQLVHLVQPIHQLEFGIRIILTYRSFNEFAVSRHRRFGWDLSKIADHYCTVNRTALLQLHTFGGCAISYDELISSDETTWAESLEEITDIAEDKLLKHRKGLLREPRHKRIPGVFDPKAEKVFAKLRKRKGETISSSIKKISSPK